VGRAARLLNAVKRLEEMGDVLRRCDARIVDLYEEKARIVAEIRVPAQHAQRLFVALKAGGAVVSPKAVCVDGNVVSVVFTVIA